ncbi:MAG: T9SS type A sorting domain-containing protein [Bacteroidales bacterium]
MKKLFTLFALLSFGFYVTGQTVVFSDGFESYTIGDALTTQSADWETWSGSEGGSEDPMITDAQASAGSQSINILADNDIIYDFGNKTSGIYSVSFDYYVVSGAEAYFNTQHSFASEWAFSCTFAAGEMTLANGETTSPTYSYTEDTWMNFQIEYNLEMDSAYLDVDGVEVAAWKFSNIESGGTGDNQLGCINFYGPANNDYYVDEFVFTEIESGLMPPEVDVSTDPIMTDGSASELITVGNTGEEALNFRAYPTYSWATPVKSGNRDGVLNYDGDNANAIGWGSTFDVMAAARFLPEYTSPFASQLIESVDVYINDAPTNDSIRVFVATKGGFITPGTDSMITEADATVTAEAWNTITLDEPVDLNGDELWVGYGFNHPDGSYVLGMDDQPLVDNGNYLKTGLVWSEFTGISDDGMGNFNIRANVVGTAAPEWMTVSPADGSIPAAASVDIDLGFVTTELTTGVYSGNVLVGCNDPDSEWNSIPVELDYFVGVEGVQSNAVMTYPNPVSDVFTIKSDDMINEVGIYNIHGQRVAGSKTADTTVKLPMNMEAGIYMVRIVTDSRTIVRKILVE